MKAQEANKDALDCFRGEMVGGLEKVRRMFFLNKGRRTNA